MKFLSDILARAGLVVEGAVTLNGVANATTDTDRFLVLDSGVVRFRTGAQILSDTGGALDSEVVHIAGTETVTGSKTFSAGISLGTVVGATGVIRNLSTDGSLVMGGSAFSNASLPARTIIISTVGTYSALTGAANLFVGRNAGASVTSGNNNVFIGKGAGSGITTGAANVLMSSSDASNLPSALSNSIHLVAGGGYRLNDASSIPTSSHVFIGGGFGSSTALRDFYFGQLPFTPDAGLTQTHITFYAPSGSGTDIPGSNFTIAGGRGTGAGTPGSVIISTSTQGASGSAVQTLVERARFNASGLTLAVITAATTDTDRFLVSDGGVVKFRTGAELLSDIGGISGNQNISFSGDISGNGTTTISTTVIGLRGAILPTTGTTAGFLRWTGATGTWVLDNTSYLTSYTETDTLATVTGRGATTSTVVTFSGGDGNNSSVKLAGYNQRGGVGFHGFLEATNTFGSATNPNKYFRLDSVGSLQIINNAYTVAILTLTDAGAFTVPGSATAGSFVRSGGTSSQFLKADGSVDSSTYLTSITSSQVTTALGYTPVPTSRTLTINGTTFDLSADRSWSITAGVSSVNAGSGISVSSTTGAVTVTNTGILSAVAGSGISVSTSGGTLSISNTGLLSALAGSGISVSTSGGTLSISNTGILSGVAGSGISVSTSGGTLSISNTGLLSATAGSGISVSTSGGTVSISNTGVLSVVAGSGISVSTSGGTVTVSNTITNNNQLTNGAGYITPNSIVSGWIAFQANTQGTPIIRAIQQDTTSGFYLFQGVTGSTEVFRIDRSGTGYFAGNLGVGTASVTSGYTVEVIGNVLLSTSGGNRSIVLTTSNANAALNTIAGSGLELASDGTNRNLAFRTGSTTAMFINSSAQVGIGTASPTQLLDVVGGNARINNGFLFVSNRPLTNILFNSQGSYYGAIQNDAGDKWSFADKLTLDGTLGTPIMTWVAGTRQVGIGTINPTQRLDVSGYIRATSGFVGNSGLQLWGDNTSTSPGLFVATGGNVGIGTNNPITFGNVLTVHMNGGSSGSFFTMAASGTRHLSIIANSLEGKIETNTSIPLLFATNEVIRLTIAASTGQLRLHNYTSSSAFTGTAVATLAVDSSGNVITVAGGGGGGVGGSGTSGFVPVFTGAATVGNSIIQSSAGKIIVVSNTDGQIIEMARSNGAYFWKFGMTSGSVFAIYNNFNTSMLELDPTSGNMTLGSGQNVNIRLGRNANDWGQLQYSGGGVVLQNGWANANGFIRQFISTNVSTTLFGSGVLQHERTSEGLFYQCTVGGNDRIRLSTDGSANVQFRTGNNVDLRLGVNEDAIVIKNGGNVGIGTNSPSYRLDVATGNDNALRIVNSLGSNNNGIALAVGSGTPWIDFWGSSFDIKYNTAPGSWNSGSNRFVTILSNGNVGINNTNPGARLHVVTASSGATAATNAIAIFENNTNGVVQINGPDSSSMGLFFGRSGAAYYSGIERTGTDLLLKNANTVAVTIASSLAVTFASSITCTSLTETSSIKIKENIAPVTAALDKVDQLKPVSYNKKGSATKEIGLIAEDVFDVFPEFVLCDDNGEPVGVHYSRLTAVLIESVKELKNKITELEKRN